MTLPGHDFGRRLPGSRPAGTVGLRAAAFNCNNCRAVIDPSVCPGYGAPSSGRASYFCPQCSTYNTVDLGTAAESRAPVSDLLAGINVTGRRMDSPP